MEALVLTAPRRFETREIDLPEPSDGDAIVEVRAVAICGSDIAGYLGQHPRIGPPTILGHELAGVVVDVGQGVEGLEVGDRVCVDPTSGCGACRLCAAGRHNICAQYKVMGEHIDLPGGMAGSVRVPASQLHRIPDEMSMREAAIVQPLSVSYHAAAHRGRVARGDVAFIAGAGPIGLGILLAAREVGAATIVSDPLDYRRTLATELGADVVLDPTSDDVGTSVRERTDGYGADVTFEAVGGSNSALLRELVDVTAAGGQVVVVGLKTETAPVPMMDMKFHEKTVTGSAAHPDSFPHVIERVASGQYPAGRLISHVFSFDEAAEAFQLLGGRDEPVQKVVLVPRGLD